MAQCRQYLAHAFNFLPVVQIQFLHWGIMDQILQIIVVLLITM